MTNSVIGFAEYDKERVIQACDRYIERRNTRIEQERELFIEIAMQPRTVLFGLIRLRDRTRDQAVALWGSEDIMHSPAARAKIKGLCDYKNVLMLRKMAVSAETATVHVSACMTHIFDIQSKKSMTNLNKL